MKYLISGFLLVVRFCSVESSASTSSDESAPFASSKIVGGGEAAPNSIPYQVALVLTGTNHVVCGGTILNRKFILTAAHCVDKTILLREHAIEFTNSTYQVIAGEHDLSNDNDSTTRHNITNVIIHPKYRSYFWKSNVRLGFDVAIIEIVDQFKLHGTSKARAVRLPSVSDINFNNSTRFKVSGWGRLLHNNTKTPKKLHVVIVPWVPDQDCNVPTSPTNLCAGNFAYGGVDSCQGDSGGIFTVHLFTAEISISTNLA